MVSSTRRSFLKNIAVTGTAFYIPRIGIAQQNWRVETVAGTGVAVTTGLVCVDGAGIAARQGRLSSAAH